MASIASPRESPPVYLRNPCIFFSKNDMLANSGGTHFDFSRCLLKSKCFGRIATYLGFHFYQLCVPLEDEIFCGRRYEIHSFHAECKHDGDTTLTGLELSGIIKRYGRIHI